MFSSKNVEKDLEACKIYFQRQTRPPKTLLELLASLQKLSARFTDVYAATCIACTLPVSGCAAERSFSTMRIIKKLHA